MPSILRKNVELMGGNEIVLNLIITGMPSIQNHF